LIQKLAPQFDQTDLKQSDECLRSDTNDLNAEQQVLERVGHGQGEFYDQGDAEWIVI
jgi:hypothetical protein